LDDSYLKELNTKIVEVITVKKKPAIALEENIFYPSGGGQPYDVGYIKEENDNKIEVVRVLKQGGKVYLCLDNDLTCGDNQNITVAINWDLRYKYMKCHTAGHLLMSEIKKNVKNYEPNGIEVAADGLSVSVSFFGTWDKKDETAQKIVDNMNNKVKGNKGVLSLYYDNNLDEYKDIFRGDNHLNSGSRIVVIEDTDANPCGGTHIKRLNEIKELNLISYEDNEFKIEVI